MGQKFRQDIQTSSMQATRGSVQVFSLKNGSYYQKNMYNIIILMWNLYI